MSKRSAKWFAVNIVVFIAILLYGIFGNITGDEMGFSLLSFYIIMPITTLICSFLASDNNIKNSIIYIILIGIAGFIVPNLIFKSKSPDTYSIFYTTIPAIIGSVIGFYLKKKR